MRSPLRWLLLLAALVGLVMTLSYVRGCWRDWGLFNPKTPPVPGRIDPGTPTEPEVRTVVVEVPIQAHDLTREEVLAEMARLGIRMPVSVGSRGPQGGEGTDPRLGIPSGEIEAPEPVQGFPLRLARESFCQVPAEDGSCPKSSPSIDVSAFLYEPGGSVDLAGEWRAYQPEPCPESRIFQNIARWRKGIGLGIVGACVENGGEKVCDVSPAAIFGADWRSVRVGPATLELSLHGGVTQKATGAVIGGLRVTW